MNYNFFGIAAAATDAAAQPSGGDMIVSMLITFVPVILIFYLFIIRPQKKRDKEDKEMRESLAIGDEIVTIGGIIGIVVRQNEDTIVIETGGDRSKLRIQKTAVKDNITARERAQAEKAAQKSASPLEVAKVSDGEPSEKKEKKNKKN
ncbi:MAG: preprotein translocase subunit YajC [Oscillospiraceae bacterium]|nr:preprotein translocase subunit YajC [Oscillospiraceae bacterium]